MVYNNLGNALADRGDLESAIGAYEKAREIYERWFRSGRMQVLPHLCIVLLGELYLFGCQGHCEELIRVATEVEALARAVMKRTEFDRLPEPFRFELRKVVTVACAVPFLPTQVAWSLREIARKLEQGLGQTSVCNSCSIPVEQPQPPLKQCKIAHFCRSLSCLGVFAYP